MAGYYVFPLAVRVSVRPSYVRLSVRSSVRPSVSTSFPFDNLSIYKRSLFIHGMCIGLGKISVGIVNEQISMSSYGVIALFMVLKTVFGL